MKLSSKQIQQQYTGFLQTPCLWKNDAVYGLQQFEIEQKAIAFDLEIDTKLRLGKYIERFVSFQLQQENGIEIISENIQIQREKITLGELDCLLLKDQKPIHLEVIYKFYLYDPSVGNSEIAHCIGPNRKDSLLQKVTKLKDKQLPLLYSNECESYLKELHLNVSEIEQQVYFKAQLFVPFARQDVQLKTLNQDCIVGFYINQKELATFKECKFYIPTKKNWLLQPHTQVAWQPFISFEKEVSEILDKESSPLCWMKHPNGEISKFFLIWWQA
ncbi:hypothetical protein KCTC32516_01992 [Polaribacter huanghezhanensis]|uniref:DUF1853 family protein n=1 Tax=Polaribacter huanghezhanensis TaxID=1354726 RepID=UPI002648F469|nr:DUF1853 family protein [Polaribacter huanghezhanensis]WKD86616.1 hypothetical protein KCTC32516_01992 [Polaribacter huanghezhanensis]